MTQHLKPRSTTVVLYQGDDMDHLALLKREVDVAQSRVDAAQEERDAAAERPQRGGDVLPAVDRAALLEAQAAYDEFVEEAGARALEVEIRSIGRRRFRDLVMEHPPRRIADETELPRRLGEPEGGATSMSKMVDHPDDAPFGVNTETFGAALLTYRDGATLTIARPEFNTRGEVESFVDDEVAEGDFDQLWPAAWMLNRGASANPKEARFWTPSRSGNAT